MKLHSIRLTAILLFGATALASFAPAADAGHRRKWRHRDDRRVQRDFRDGFRIQSCEGSESGYDASDYGYDGPSSRGRSYYYHDPYCGLTHSHVSSFKAHYSSCGHPRLIRKVDIRTQRVIKTYAYDDGGWRTWDREYRVAGRDGCGHSGDRDRYANYDQEYWDN
jgi:hypothetical protein